MELPFIHGEADDGRLDAVHRQFAVTRDPELRAQLAEEYEPLVFMVLRQFRTRRDTFDDLAQVARIGLLHALDRFDPERGHSFAAFARVTMTGELKRHLRDRTWTMRVPRGLQEHYLLVVRTADDLTAKLGRSPRVTEVAEACGLSEEEVLQATDVGRSQYPTSFDRPTDDGDDRLVEPAVVDVGYESVENRSLTSAVLAGLPKRDRDVLELYFVEGMTQREIAHRIGTSQMYVSRHMARVLARLRLRTGQSVSIGTDLPPLASRSEAGRA